MAWSLILRWPYISSFFAVCHTFFPIIPMGQVQKAAPSHSPSLLSFNQCRPTPTVFRRTDDKWLAIILFRLLQMEIKLSWLMPYMTPGTLRRRDLSAYPLISTLGYPPFSDWYHVRSCRGGRFTRIVCKLFWEESYSLLWCITMSSLRAPPYQSVRKAKSLRVCLVSFLAIKGTLLNMVDAPFLGTGRQKIVHCQCRFENELLL